MLSTGTSQVPIPFATGTAPESAADGASTAARAGAIKAATETERLTSVTSGIDRDIDDQRLLDSDVVPAVLDDRRDSLSAGENAFAEDVVAADGSFDGVAVQIDLCLDIAELSEINALSRTLRA